MYRDMKIGNRKNFTVIRSPLDTCGFYAELSDDYKVVMTNFAGDVPLPKRR